MIDQVTLDALAEFDITLVKMYGMMPMFWGGEPQAMDLIEKQGINLYYLIGLDETTTEGPNKTVKIVRTPTVLRVESSFVGRSVTIADFNEIELFTTTKANLYTYNLPKMPYAFVERIDAFFRKAHKIHGTESILVLTFDTSTLGTTDPGSGWGCIAPKQENTAANCKYEMDSVMQQKPANVSIVGTWHSHPEMPAYFSSTDHHDQDDWDGIHITTGWKGNTPSEYYICVISNGTNFTYEPEHIFAPPPVPVVDITEVDGWLTNVGKQTHQIPAHKSYYDSANHNNAYNKGPIKTAHIKMPPGSPDPRTNTIIARHDFAGKHLCPFCFNPFGRKAMQNMRCMTCESFVIPTQESLPSLIAKRESQEATYVLEIDPEKAPHPIIIWDVAENQFSTDLRVVSNPK